MKEERRKKLVYDEDKGEWVPKWGYKGKNKNGEGDWLIEVNEKKSKVENGQDGRTARGVSKAERMERIRRNERKMRANERNSKRGTTKA
jgi:regulator of ribosome biosynthesis